MKGQRLLTVTEEKDLGVVISSGTKSSQQCIQAYSKASRILAMINRTIIYIKVHRIWYISTSHWYVHISNTVRQLGHLTVKDKVLIDKIQRRFTRMIPWLKNLQYEDRLRELNLWTFEDRRERADLIEGCKIVRRLSSIMLEAFLNWITKE